MNPAERDALNREADELVARIRPLLVGHHPAVVGEALAELLALWIAGHHAAVRRELFDMQVDAIKKLYPVAAKFFWDGNEPKNLS